MSQRKIKKTRHYDRLTIPEYFEDKYVFITGATGFMGKVLLEKILRSCPNVKAVYILLRAKKGKDIQARVKEMISLPLFVRLKRENEAAFDKIVPLNGDAALPKLGLSEDDIQLLQERVSVVFHVAASVRFDEPLRSALDLNTCATYEMVKLALGMKKLESFLHVSTTYANTHKDEIDEKIYPAPEDWRKVIKIVSNLDDHTLQIMTPKILGQFPNTYTFTKALAEHVVWEHRDRLPLVVLRPSIVISTLLEPMPGWIDNFNGPVGLLIASGKGIIRKVYTNPDVRSDFMPVDAAVKSMIVAAWDRATALEPFEEAPVYNCSSYDIKNVTQADIVEIGRIVTQEVPLNDILWLPQCSIASCIYDFYLNVFLFHVLPAFLVDFALKFLGKPPLLAKIQRRIFVANMALSYFLTKQWNFKNSNLVRLDENILHDDLQAFHFNTPEFDIMEYFKNCAFGGRQYLLKEDNADIDLAKAHYKKMYWVDRVTKIILIAIFAWCAVNFGLIRFLRNYLLDTYTFILDLNK